MSAPRALEAYPLSHMQKGMLFNSVSAPGSDMYIEQLTCALRGDLDLASFQFAWEEMLRRHAALRTAFAWRGLPEPLQVVGSRVRLPLETLDWRHLRDDERQPWLDHLRNAPRIEGVDLAPPPLM